MPLYHSSLNFARAIPSVFNLGLFMTQHMVDHSLSNEILGLLVCDTVALGE
jgi:hypothetical protein